MRLATKWLALIAAAVPRHPAAALLSGFSAANPSRRTAHASNSAAICLARRAHFCADGESPFSRL